MHEKGELQVIRVCCVIAALFTVNGDSAVTSSGDSHPAATTSVPVNDVTAAGTAMSNGDVQGDSQRQQQKTSGVSTDTPVKVSDVLQLSVTHSGSNSDCSGRLRPILQLM